MIIFLTIFLAIFDSILTGLYKLDGTEHKIYLDERPVETFLWDLYLRCVYITINQSRIQYFKNPSCNLIVVMNKNLPLISAGLP